MSAVLTERSVAAGTGVDADEVAELRRAVAELRDQVRHLTEALASRDLIWEAKVIIVGSLGCSSDEAFQVLRDESQRENRKVRDIAEALVAMSRRQLRAVTPSTGGRGG